MAEIEATLLRTTFRPRWRVKYSTRRRRNDLLPALGLLELSNALDFAANVWNTEPPPTIAKVFMALGATGALLILAFASFDLFRAWRNIVILRQERKEIFSVRDPSKCEVGKPNTSEVSMKTVRDLNLRELGNEAIDRFGMGILLGFGALTVGIGTYLAIDGANPTAFLASNIITGYVGNVPAALFGITNALWAIHGWRRAQRHRRAAANMLGTDSQKDRHGELAKAIRRHSKRIKWHAVVNGVDAMLGGAGSLMTASAYIVPVGVWGYVILFPASIAQFSLNIYWRMCLNYERECVGPWSIDIDKLLNDADHALATERLLSQYRKDLKPSNTPSKEKPTDLQKRSLLNLLIAHNTLTAEWLSNESERLTERLEGLGEENYDKEGLSISNLHAQVTDGLATIREQMNKTDTRLTQLRAATTLSEKQREYSQYLDALFDFLLSTALFPSLCEDLANDSKLSQVLGKKLSSTRELNIKPSVLRQQITSDQSLTGPFLNLTCKMLSTTGVKLARSRVRYYCELCGVALSFSNLPVNSRREMVENTESPAVPIESDPNSEKHQSKPVPSTKVT